MTIQVERPDWTVLIAAFERSQISQPQFCAQHRLTLSTFRYYLYRLRKRSQEEPVAESSSFVQLRGPSGS